MKPNLLYILIALFLYSCSSSTPISDTNFTDIYTIQSASFQPQFTVYHINDSVTEINYKIIGSEIITSSNNVNLKIAGAYYKTVNDVYSSDTASIYIADNFSQKNDLIGSFKMRIKKGENGLIIINSSDINSGKLNTQYLPINKVGNFSSQNFLATYQNNVLFNNNTQGNEIEVLYKYADELVVKYYATNFPLPLPPFSLKTQLPFDDEPTDKFYVSLNNYKGSIDTKKEGFYFISSENNPEKGITLTNYGKDFPHISNLASIIEPMRFISSKKEFIVLTESTDSLQFFFEKFWLKCTSEPQRAKLLIKNYYDRIEISNNLFTNYCPGWKTDRGIIYLVFGTPNVVKKTHNKESWTYGEENNYMSVNFVFNKRRNKFSDNDFILSRSSIYKSHWYRAVDNWRQGKIQLN